MTESTLTERRSSPLPYASLRQIRLAIQRRRLIRFWNRGQEVTAEPHLLGKATRTSAYHLKCYFPGDDAWRCYGFAEIRGFEELKETFSPRTDVWANERKIAEIDTQARW